MNQRAGGGFDRYRGRGLSPITTKENEMARGIGGPGPTDEKKREENQLDGIAAAFKAERETLNNIFTGLEKIHMDLHGVEVPYEPPDPSDKEARSGGAYDVLRDEREMLNNVVKMLNTASNSLAEKL